MSTFSKSAIATIVVSSTVEAVQLRMQSQKAKPKQTQSAGSKKNNKVKSMTDILQQLKDSSSSGSDDLIEQLEEEEKKNEKQVKEEVQGIAYIQMLDPKFEDLSKTTNVDEKLKKLNDILKQKLKVELKKLNENSGCQWLWKACSRLNRKDFTICELGKWVHSVKCWELHMESVLKSTSTGFGSLDKHQQETYKKSRPLSLTKSKSNTTAEKMFEKTDKYLKVNIVRNVWKHLMHKLDHRAHSIREMLNPLFSPPEKGKPVPSKSGAGFSIIRKAERFTEIDNSVIVKAKREYVKALFSKDIQFYENLMKGLQKMMLAELKEEKKQVKELATEVNDKGGFNLALTQKLLKKIDELP